MRVVFAGTPEVALPALEAIAASDHDLVGVVTRPDAPSGRGRKLVPSPVCQPLPSAVAIGISTPGAARSTNRDLLEKPAIALARSLAATVSTCGMLAGYPSGLPTSPSLPEAATTSVPFLIAS